MCMCIYVYVYVFIQICNVYALFVYTDTYAHISVHVPVALKRLLFSDLHGQPSNPKEQDTVS